MLGHLAALNGNCVFLYTQPESHVRLELGYVSPLWSLALSPRPVTLHLLIHREIWRVL